jgi:O-antigen/teichoic acid export membrane protein
MSIAQRSVRSSMYTIIGSGINTVVSFFRSIILARLIAPEIFGIYSFTTSFILITASIPIFGMSSALLHHAPESEGEEALRVHFTIALIFNTIWAIVIAIIGAFVFPHEYLWLLLIFLATQFTDNLVITSRTILIRNVLFKRIAIIDTLNIILPTISAILFAWKGYGIIGLISTDVVAAIVLVFGFLIIRPPWRVRFGWSPEIARYFLNFGYRTFLGNLIRQALDNLDNLWTGQFLGAVSLGYYSRAYTFSTYPRKVLANPINSVASGTYAELKNQRKQLSQAFFRSNALLIRTGFLMAGWLALIAPEFINLIIGKEWLPMLVAFRLMLLFTLLDPIRTTLANLFIAVGKPERVFWTRLAQLAVLITGLFILGNIWGIAGVAIAVNLMILTGIITLLWQARVYVDFSVIRLFGVPSLALIVGMILGRLSINIPGILGSYWRTGIVKTVVFCAIYILVVVILEYKELPMLLKYLSVLLPKREATTQVMYDSHK